MDSFHCKQDHSYNSDPPHLVLTHRYFNIIIGPSHMSRWLIKNKSMKYWIYMFLVHLLRFLLIHEDLVGMTLWRTESELIKQQLDTFHQSVNWVRQCHNFQVGCWLWLRRPQNIKENGSTSESSSNNSRLTVQNKRSWAFENLLIILKWQKYQKYYNIYNKYYYWIKQTLTNIISSEFSLYE